ncbi:hypothetical protein AMELA_G00061790 [Ameiurus melas]|uniref:Uncharacterized protein n=1 Tax=Ameiurus melas TaxID=219545 RepID=A0A7J6B5L1_AMEME|nr:hypothetical protein AMELA_G00061790 [Ameiurus melas]
MYVIVPCTQNKYSRENFDPATEVMLRAVTKCLLTNPVASGRMMSHGSFAGKVAIVTASTDGIGLAAAQALGRSGAHVVVSSRRQANVDKAVSAVTQRKHPSYRHYL